MKVKYINDKYKVTNVTIGRLYDAISHPVFKHHIRILDDDNISQLVCRYHFITVEEERNIKLNDILNES